MYHRFKLVLGLSLFATFCAAAQSGRSIRVDVTYTGTGTVDANHKIYVALWDTADSSASPPVDVKSIAAKKGSVTFTDVAKVPAYVSVAYDPTGSWQAQSPPPSGSSIGVYSDHPPTPSPIDVAPGKTATVKLTFDDKVKIP